MTSIKDSFESTLEEFKKDLTPKEIDKFQFATLEEFEEAALIIQKDQENTKSMKHMGRIQSFLEGMQQFGKVVDVFLNASPFVCFVWGPLKFILQTASTWADSFELIVDAYGNIGNHMPLLKQYKDCFGNSEHIKRILPLIYSDILTFHKRALKFFRGKQSVWRQILKSSWKNYNTRYQSILDSLQRHKLLLAEQSALLHMQQSEYDSHLLRAHIRKYEDDRGEMLKSLNRQEADELLKQQKSVLEWFSAASTIFTDHEDLVRVRQKSAGNGSWILQEEKVGNWIELDTPESSILWIQGMPGAGKTVLASVIVDACFDNTLYNTSYFYCKDNGEEKKDCISIYRGLLSQLLNKCHDLVPHCYEKSLGSGEIRLTSLSLAQNLLALFCEKIPRQCIIIDGIDECDQAQRKLLFEFWLDLVRKIEDRDPGKIRIAFISQLFPDIEKALQEFTVLKLTSKHNQEDIEKFTESWCVKIQEKHDPRGEQMDKFQFIKEATCIRAEGMFLFAKLVLENLYAQERQEDLFNEIQSYNFPEGIEDAYERILVRMKRDLPDAKWKIAKKILGWMVCSKRALKWREMQAVMSLDLEQQTISFESKKMRSEIQEYCGSLIQVTKGQQVELVHTTAKIYIVRSKYVHAPVVEYNLTGMCLQYLTFSCFNDDTEIDEESLKALAHTGILSFQDYAIAKWMDHVRAIVQTYANDLGDGEGYTEALECFSMGVTDFTERYQAKILPNDDILEDVQSECQRFETYDDFYEDLLNLYNHIYTHNKKDSTERNTISIETLEKVLARNRTLLEGLSPPKSKARDDLTEFYGDKRFKCPKIACYYFHEGFKDASSRDQHIKRHDRPFICTFPDCSITEFGFASNKGLEKHIKTCHPNDEELASKFLPRARAAAATPHACRICPKKFTRKFHLDSHTRSHMGQKPFPCPECGRPFARANDMRRHEKNMHFGKR